MIVNANADAIADAHIFFTILLPIGISAVFVVYFQKNMLKNLAICLKICYTKL